MSQDTPEQASHILVPKGQTLRHALLMVGTLFLLASFAFAVQWIGRRGVHTDMKNLPLPSGPRFFHRAITHLPPSAQAFLKAHIQEGTPYFSGASFQIQGTHRSDLSNPWLPFQGRHLIRGLRGYLLESTIQIGVLSVHHQEFLFPQKGQSRTHLLGLLPLDGRKGPSALQSNRERLALDLVLIPTLLVPNPDNPVLWRENAPGEPAYSLPRLAPGRWVSLKLDKRGLLVQASLSRLADFLAPEKQKHFPYTLKTLGFPKSVEGVRLPSALALGWHQVYEEQELPYPDLEKPQPDGFAEMTRYKINEIRWLRASKSP